MPESFSSPGQKWKPKNIHLFIPDNERAQRIGERLQRMLETAGLPLASEVTSSDDLVLTLGGDGTFLEALHKYHHIGPVFCGINAGNLGFLHEIDEDNLIQAVDRLLKGQTFLEYHRSLSVEVIKEPGTEIVNTFQSFNDVVVERRAARALRLSLRIDGHDLGSMIADGILVATAGGSTGYALAARGAVIHPDCPVIQIIPLHAHRSRISFSLDVPLIVPQAAVVEIEPAWSPLRTPRLVIDGQERPFNEGEMIRVSPAEGTIRILRMGIAGFWERMREKFR